MSVIVAPAHPGVVTCDLFDRLHVNGYFGEFLSLQKQYYAAYQSYVRKSRVDDKEDVKPAIRITHAGRSDFGGKPASRPGMRVRAPYGTVKGTRDLLKSVVRGCTSTNVPVLSARIGGGGSVNDGYCYLLAIRPDSAEKAKLKFGAWPTCNRLFFEGRDMFRTDTELKQLSVVDGWRGLHVLDTPPSPGGVSVSDLMALPTSTATAPSKFGDELTRIGGEDDGFCYLRIFNSDFHEDIKRGLGSYPSLAAISRVPANVRLSEPILSKLWLVQRGQCLHVEDQPFEDANTVFRVLKLVDGFVLPEYTQTWISMRVGGRDRLVMENTSPFLGEFDPFASPDYDDGFPRVGGKGDRLSLRREIFVPCASKGMPLVRLDLRGTVSVGVSAGCSVPFSLPLNSVVELGKECYGRSVVCADGYEGVLVWNSVERICELYDDSNFDYLRDFCNF